MTPESPPSLYAPREPVFPRRVSGFFRRFKWWIMAITLGIYYLTPWIRWDRGPSLPDQAVLVDITNRRFYFFWIEIWSHEFYFVAGLLIMAGLGLFLFTSALGRVWCGYSCPQTVWTDLFILVERWIEGDRNARVRLHHAKWDFRKWRLRLTKWFVWMLISVATGGAWTFYFTDAPGLALDLVTLGAHPVAYTTIAILTATTFVLGGFLREQVCIYMCPWPRIQAAMMDTDTITIAYRDWRGEPRKKGKVRRNQQTAALNTTGGTQTVRYAGTPYPGQEEQAGSPDIPAPAEAGPGDCIDCMACVNVCPVGIDIRNGQQMECITCGLCIDACDEIMARTGKERGLIDYLSFSDETAERAGEAPVPLWKHILRPRTIVYTALWALIGLGMMYALFIRSDIEIAVSPLRNPVYVTLSDGSVRNIYDIRLRNKLGTDRVIHLSLSSEEILRIELEGTDGDLNITVPANKTLLQRVYVTARPQDPASQADSTALRFWAEDIATQTRTSGTTTFNGKGG